jgi:hypothetical protein
MDGTTATPSSGSATTGPTSFSDPSLTWSDAPSASTPAAESQPADSASASTTETPAASAPETGPPQQGEPPQERWADILANTRTKEREAALSEWRQKHGWAEQVNQQEYQQVAELAKRASADPIGYLTDFIKELQSSPEHAAQLRSLAARALAQRSSTPQGPDLNPIQVQLENGQTVGLYSAEQIAALKGQWLTEAEQKFAPAMQTVEQLRAQQQEAVRAQQQQREIAQFTTTTMQDVQTWPGMDSEANRKAVAEELGRMTMASDDPREVSLALNAAWRKVVAPTLTHKAESQLLDSLKTKAAAATSVNPGSSAPSSPRTITRFDQLPADAWR